MTAQTFIFGGDGMPKTPQELARLRAMAEALAPRRTPKDVGEGIASIGNAIAMRMMMNRANKAEDTALKADQEAFSSLFSPDAASSDAITTPQSVSTVPSIKSPQDAVDAAPFKATNPDTAGVENYIREAAIKRSMDPDQVIKAARSEGLAPGVWQSNVMKDGMREPSFGPFQMLYGDGKTFPKGLGNVFHEKTGLDPRDPKNVNAMIDFALDTAKREGWQQWFGPKNIGMGNWDGINRDQVASLDNSMPSTTTERVPVVPVPDGFEQPDPLANTQPVKVADSSNSNSTTVAKALTRKRVDERKALQYLQSPWASDGRRAVIQSLLKQQYDMDAMERKQQLEQADPLYQQNLRKGEIELRNLERPKQSRTMSAEEERAAGLPEDGVYQVDPIGNIKTIREPSKPIDALNAEKTQIEINNLKNPQIAPAEQARLELERQKFEADQAAKTAISPLDQAKLDMDREKLDWEKSKKPETIQKYEYYKQSMEDLGQPALGPLEWEQALRSSSASRNEVNIDQKTEGAFDKKLAEKQAETFNTMADEGVNARADIEIINQLDDFLKGQGGTGTGLSGVVARWGVPFEGADDLQAAEALINKLVPTQRQPGSGTMSDRDVELFKSSLPSLWNQPGGNEKIIGVMRGLAEYKQRQGEIADQVIMGELTRQEARRALRELPNPLEEFRKQQKAKKAEIDGYTIEEVPE